MMTPRTYASAIDSGQVDLVAHCYNFCLTSCSNEGWETPTFYLDGLYCLSIK